MPGATDTPAVTAYTPRPPAPAGADDLVETIRRSRTLRERLARAGEAALAQPPSSLTARQLRRWMEAACRGDARTFARLLRFDSIAAPAERGLSPVEGGGHGDASPEGGDASPEWTGLLAEWIPAAKRAGPPGESPRLADHRPTTETEVWHDLFLPVLATARERLRARLGEAYATLTAEAHAALEHDLLSSCVEFGGAALRFEFQAHQAVHRPTMSRLLDPEGGSSADQLHEFLATLDLTGLGGLLREYPMLARILCVLACSWVDTSAELVTRVNADWDEIRDAFDPGPGPCVTSIEPRRSDRHHGGRSVAILQLASGVRIVYKPRSLGIEEAYNSFIEWLNGLRPPLPLHGYRVLDRGTHGWAEFVAEIPPASGEERERYFHRCGMLLCLAHVLGATDLHRDNLLAHGEHPVLIDLETLMHPNVREELPPDETFAAAHQLEWESVLRTGLLPYFATGGNDAQWRFSGISARLDPGGDSPHASWESVVEGFRATYRLLAAHRDRLLARDGPLRPFANREIRFVFRATQLYTRVLTAALEPAGLRDGVEFGITLEILNRVGQPFSERPSFWPLVVAERKALAELDIPCFRASTSLSCLYAGPDEAIPGFFLQSGLDDARARIGLLSPADLEHQVDLIAGSLLSRTLGGAEHRTRALREPGETGIHATDEELIGRAAELGAELVERKFEFRGAPAWISPGYTRGGILGQFRPVREDLYCGASGIALFLAALARITGSLSFEREALRVLTGLGAAGAAPRHGSEPELGSCIGVGSVVYALASASRILEAPALARRARRLAGALSDDLIAADRRFDVFWGCAGAILGLLRLHDETGDAWVLERAVRCGGHLVDHRTEDGGSRLRGWATSRGRLLTGFSHGAAGIAHALARLHHATGEAAFLDAAREAVAFEDSLFVPEESNWSQFPGSGRGRPDLLCTWCHGAPGIGLSRLANLEALGAPEARARAADAASTVLALPLDELDHLCCGNLGRVELLLFAGRTLGRTDLVQEARSRAARIVSRARHESFRYGIPAFVPGFFTGASGVGYELLRLARPEQLPSVLLWE